MVDVEHNDALLDRLARVHEGNAKAHLRRIQERPERKDHKPRNWSTDQMLAASSLVISGSYYSMIAPQKAVQVYRQAAQIYRDLQHPYWVVLAVASAGERDIDAVNGTMAEVFASTAHEIAFGMIASQIPGTRLHESADEHLMAQWRSAGNPPVGRLRIPLDYYGSCAQAMRVARERNDFGAFVTAAANFLHRASETIRTASHDRFHWHRLQSAVLPAEPEAVAMAAAMSMVSNELFQTRLTQLPDLDSGSQLLVRIGESMREAGRGRSERPQ
jgi:hypothetical protein